MKNIFITTAALLLSVTVFCQAGTLDKSFSNDGKVITGFGYGDDYGHSVAIQSDGNIVVAGDVLDGTNTDFGLVRYNTNGTLDNTFSSNGKVSTGFGGFDGANGVAIQSNGKIVAAGYADNDFALVRYNSNGSLDNTFGGDGKVATDFGGFEEGYSMAIQSDGKIVVVGSTTASGGDLDFAVARYNSNGTLDNSFGGDGKVITAFGGDDGAYTVAIQQNGKIVVAGWTNGDGGDDDFAISRYNTNGTLDNTFSGDGKLIIGFGGDDVATSVAIQDDGKIVIVGWTTAGGFALARLNKDGTMDITFGGGDGKVTSFFGGGDVASSVAIQSDGKILVAGVASFFPLFALARYNENGTLDNSFNGGGLVLTSFGGTDEALSVAIQSNGKIIAAGYTTASGGDYDFAVARYHGDNAAPEIIASESPNENTIAKEKLSAIRIFPNPVTNVLNIQGLNASSSTTISITGLSGTILKTFTVTGSEYKFDASMLKPGMYYVRIVTKDGTNYIKFIKQ